MRTETKIWQRWACLGELGCWILFLLIKHMPIFSIVLFGTSLAFKVFQTGCFFLQMGLPSLEVPGDSVYFRTCRQALGRLRA